MGDPPAVELDLRGKSVPETGFAILRAYNRMAEGERLAAVVDSLSVGLRMWLLEAGARHEAEAGDGAVRLRVRRGLCPAQGMVPGLHDVAASPSGEIWTCERARRLACFDGASGAPIKSAALARKASHLALDPGGRWVFVADPGDGVLLAVDRADLAVRHRIAAPGQPALPLVVGEDTVCVTGAGSGTVTVAHFDGQKVAERIVEVGSCPHDPVASKDGKYLFVPCAGDAAIVKLRLADGAIVGRYPVGDGPSHLALHPDGTRIYSANSFDGTLSCISPEGDDLGTVPSGAWAHFPALTPDGRHVLVANFLDDTVAVFAAETLARVATFETDAYPHGLDISPDGAYAVVTGFSSDHLRVFDLASLTLAARIEVGRGSSHSAFSRDRRTAWVACSVDDHLARIDLGEGRCAGTARID